MRHSTIITAVTAVALFLGVQGPAVAQAAPRIDVVFLLDATGSMGDEIGAVKEKIRDMISDIALGEPTPDVRFGIVAYRDREDEYVTRSYPLTRDIDQIVDDLDQIDANGGGDYPESLNEGLHMAVSEMVWDARAARLVFLIADAPPHMDYEDDYDYRDEVQIASEAGIVVHAIGASGLDEEGERVFRDIADGTQGAFQWLVYESRYLDQDGEEVVVRVEGREATYTKGDSTWTSADGYAPGGLGRGVELAVDADGVVPTTAEGSGSGTKVSTTTNLGDLITTAIKGAAEADGVDYSGDPTAIESVSWATVKAQVSER